MMNKLFLIPVFAVILLSGCTTTPPITTTSSSSSATQSQTTTSMQASSTSTTTLSGNVRHITLSITHTGGYSFSGDGVTSSTAITVNRGDTLVITASSDPLAHKHGYAIDALGVNVEVDSNGQVNQFVANQTGTFQIYCKSCLSGPLGAHPQLSGTLTVI